jgi:catechol 2,3-dioxygenase-like lactoylglutathione lyase family enzyme
VKVKGFNHVTIRVSDLERSLGFYRDLLDMKLVHRGKTDAYLEWGTAWVALVEKKPSADSEPGGDAGFGVDHVAFSIDEEDFDEAARRLEEAGVPIVRGPIRRGIGRSINFLDPDGTQLELHTSNLRERMTVWS